MFNVQGKNVVIVGGLNGVGLALTKTVLNKKVNKLYIIDVTENVALMQELRTQYQTTQINFQRIDYLKQKAGEIQNAIQNIVMKMQYIDVFINALEMTVEKDLQRTMDINMKLYLNMMMLVRNVMDRNKGGRGGAIVNVLSNLGLKTLEKNNYDTKYDVQQYLINKQMLLSLTKSFADEIYFQQTGVKVMSIMPVINQKMIVKNIDWIKSIGLQNLLVDVNAVRGQNQNTLLGNNQQMDFDFLGNNYNDQELYNTYQYEQDFLSQGHYNREQQDRYTLENQDRYNLENQDRYAYGTQSRYTVDDYLNNDLVYGQRIGGNNGNIRKLLDVLSYKIVRVIEVGQNGTTTVVGLGGVKNIQQSGNLSRL